MRPTHIIEGSGRLFGRRASNPQAASLLAVAVLFGCVGLPMLLSHAPAHAQTDTSAAAPSSLSIAIFVSSRNDRCFDSGDVAAINQSGEGRTGSHQCVWRHLASPTRAPDPRRQAGPDRPIANVKAALANPRTVAMIGLSRRPRQRDFRCGRFRHWHQRHSVPVGHQRQQRLRKAGERIHDASLAR